MSHTVVSHRRVAPAETSFNFNFTNQSILQNQSYSGLIRDYRLSAWKLFEDLPFPKITDEPWRRTDIRKLNASSFRLPQSDEYKDLPAIPDELLQPLVSDQHGGQIQLSPRGSKIDLASELSQDGVIFCDLATAEREHIELLSRIMGQVVHSDEGKFAALSAALSQNGIFLYVPAGIQVKQPLHSILWGPGIGLAYLSHLVVWLDEGASATYVHESASPTEQGGQTLHAGIVEIHVGAEANLRFVELQTWGEHVWNFTHERVRVDRDANLDWIFVAEGSHLTKNFTNLDLIGEGATGRLSGFYFADGDQHLDHDTQQNHLAPHTASDLLFKGALKDQSRSVWQGMIYVAPQAQKTDGYQVNRNLVLSRQARADSIPGLEILADDVRCTHGATVGKIDPEEIFYLQSRGIPLPEAERLIVTGFFDPIMQRIPYEGVKERMQQAVLRKMA